ncbi:hypothetical protein, partial [Rhizobium leguminosarum]|uniref:hypothetical protein n=1 Tax=Rhizobium leguminosarum TaxID=384 RepID=UPI003D7C28EC
QQPDPSGKTLMATLLLRTYTTSRDTIRTLSAVTFAASLFDGHAILPRKVTSPLRTVTFTTSYFSPSSSSKRILTAVERASSPIGMTVFAGIDSSSVATARSYV